MVGTYLQDSIFWVEVDRIKPNPFQPRKSFDELALASLAESIRQYGVLQPLTVTRKEIELPEKGISVEYELIAGERRLRAAKLAGIAQVPVVIRNAEDTDRMKLELAIIENLQREDLNALDRAKAFQRLFQEFGLKHIEIGKRVGKSREYVSNTLRILLLPQVRDSEQLARRVAVEKVRKSDLSPELLLLERELTEKLGTRVRIERKDQGGKVLIDFFSVDDLAHIRSVFSNTRSGAPVAPVQPPVVENVPQAKNPDEAPASKPAASAEQEPDLYSTSNFTV